MNKRVLKASVGAMSSDLLLETYFRAAMHQLTDEQRTELHAKISQTYTTTVRRINRPPKGDRKAVRMHYRNLIQDYQDAMVKLCDELNAYSSEKKAK